MSSDAAPRTGVTGQYTTDGVPHGSTSLTPFLVISDARGAIDFYRDVFGARVVDVTEMSGVVAHAELDLGHGKLQLGAPLPDFGLVPPPAGQEVCYSMGLYCPDVDAVVEAARQAGAVIREPATTFVSGDRYASLRDPFGVRWTVMTRVEDLSEADSARRVAQWIAEQAQS
ncbi:VOC family protein [Actinomyces howellii]|uniref:Predicted enzyme related to lactoylglutathione lyase n=1 Tax=Actinomyces howellii TaxID=52771 RepID=A0A448HDV5_9ACTO|nr:VOC family protein [Actinomyces howellii]VEG26212.1 Predicted enzyme related to lactoylglutathione lyase [Actinomyces howellii]